MPFQVLCVFSGLMLFGGGGVNGVALFDDLKKRTHDSAYRKTRRVMRFETQKEAMDEL